MKKIIPILLIAAVVAGTALAMRPKGTDDIIRFHVKANSDSAADQALKLQVRDELIAYINPLLQQAEDVDAARTILTAHLDGIRQVADEAIRANGATYTSRVTLEHQEFPTRQYDGKRYPQGVYEALMVRLGEAEGENWWCVAYPTLCFVSVSSRSTPQRTSLFAWIRSWFD